MWKMWKWHLEMWENVENMSFFKSQYSNFQKVSCGIREVLSTVSIYRRNMHLDFDQGRGGSIVRVGHPGRPKPPLEHYIGGIQISQEFRAAKHPSFQPIVSEQTPKFPRFPTQRFWCARAGPQAGISGARRGPFFFHDENSES